MAKSWSIFSGQSQAGVQDNISSTYARGNADITFVPGQRLMVRFSTNIPRGATINSSSFILNIYSNKDAAGSMTHQITAESVGDSDRLVEGRDEWGRQTTNAFVTWNNTWTAGVGDVENRTTPSLNSVIQEVVNRPDWKPGGYITLILTCTAESGDMRARLNNNFVQRPELNIDWSLTDANDNRRTQINLCENPNFEPALDTSVYDPGSVANGAIGTWYQNPFFGYDVDEANYGSTARATAGERPPRVAGRNVMKFTVGTPPAANNKGTGPYCQVRVDGDKSYVFAGWLYIPAATTETVQANCPYLGYEVTITARDQWVPFCTRPYSLGEASPQYRYFQVRLMPPLTAGHVFYLSEPTVLEANYQQMPWSGLQVDSDFVDYGIGLNNQHGYRQWIPRQWYKDAGGTPRPRSKWILNSSGLLTLAEGVKGGPAVQGLPAAAVTTLSGNIGGL